MSARAAIVERIQVSPAGPLLRAVVSRVTAPVWRWRGSPLPAPPHVKRSIVADEVVRWGVQSFVETGTFRGDTLAHVRKVVPRSYSIELDHRLAELARHRFRKQPDVTVLEGDSADVLPELVAELTSPALFWLDGHFSGGVTAIGDTATPIEAELATVLAPGRPAHIVLVDDARLFIGDDGYPTVECVRERVRDLRPDATVTVAQDIIWIVPQS